jgi:hypothetical protein
MFELRGESSVEEVLDDLDHLSHLAEVGIQVANLPLEVVNSFQLLLAAEVSLLFYLRGQSFILE